MPNQELRDILLSGGYVLVLLILVSIASTAIIIRCFIELRYNKLLPSSKIETIENLIKDGLFTEAGNICKEETSFIFKIFLAVLSNKENPFIVQEKLIEQAGVREISVMMQAITPLSIISVVSPVLGLLGTVLGMMQSFYVIAYNNALGSPELLAAGVSKALVTTAAGLIVALPSMCFFYYFKNIIQKISIDASSIAMRCLVVLSTRR